MIFAEIALRIFNYPPKSTSPEEYREPNFYYHHDLIANSKGYLQNGDAYTNFTVNSFGLRDYEFEMKKTKPRILMLGDSFTEGQGVSLPDTVPKQLEKMFNNTVQVINGGIGSFSPILEYLYLKHKGLKFDPDMIILNLDQGDFRDTNYMEKNAYFLNGELIAVPGGNINHDCFNFQLCLLAYNTMYKFISMQISIKSKKEPNVKYALYFTLKDQSQNISDDFIIRTFKYIKKIKNLCDEKNIIFILTLYPYGSQVSEDEWVKGRIENGITSMQGRYSFEKSEELAKEYNITFINLLPDFIEADNQSKEPLFHNYDAHMTARGYKVMAEGIYNTLQSISKTK